MLKDKNILISGGAGFIGSHLAEFLQKDNYVTVVDDMSLGKIENIKSMNINFIEKSVLDDIDPLLDGVDVVFHLAAIPGVQDSIEHPVLTSQVNFTGTAKMLELARKKGAETFVFASSCAIYGNPEELPVSEKASPDPLSPYATQKLASEYLVKNYSELYGMKGSSARFFNVYGPRQDPFSEYSAVIPKFINSCLKGGSPIIFGSGKQTRDFVYVKDIVRGLILMAELPHGEDAINLGSGREISVNELAHTIIEETGCGMEPEHAPARPGEVERSLSDISLARTVLGWSPEYTLKQGIKETVESFRHKHI